VKLLVVSPHMDDAVLSAGEALAEHRGSTVLTLFAGKPAEPVITSFDANCGFRDSSEAVVARWGEDDAALRVLEASPMRAPFLDDQYPRPGVEGPTLAHRDLVFSLAGTIARAAVAVGPNLIVGPLGLMHPDHELATTAFLNACEGIPHQAWVYEDLPSRITNPESVEPALDRIRARGWTLDRLHLGSGLASKRLAMAAYRSQRWALDERLYLVPERTWRLSR
jgi:LmbE family N-acetylglucosaminyl deacetylase